MNKYDVYYYGCYMCYVSAKTLEKAKEQALRVLDDLVEDTVNSRRMKVLKV